MARLPGPILRTDRLFLQTPKMRDVEDIYKWTCDPAITRYMSWSSPRSPRETETFVRDSMRDQRSGKSLAYLLHDVESGQAIGACGAHNLDATVHLKAEVGYWIAKPYWGRGLVSEALRVLLPHLFVNVGLHRLSALVFHRNARSARVLEGLGFQHEGLLRHNLRKSGRSIDVMQYAMLSTDPSARTLIKQRARGAPGSAA